MPAKYRRQVRFWPQDVTLYARPPKRNETEALESFNRHASLCVTCCHFLVVPSAVIYFCSDGLTKASAVLRLLYAFHGRIYAVQPQQHLYWEVVELYSLFRISQAMVFAMERSEPRMLRPAVDLTPLQEPERARLSEPQVRQRRSSRRPPQGDSGLDIQEDAVGKGLDDAPQRSQPSYFAERIPHHRRSAFVRKGHPPDLASDNVHISLQQRNSNREQHSGCRTTIIISWPDQCQHCPKYDVKLAFRDRGGGRA